MNSSFCVSNSNEQPCSTVVTAKAPKHEEDPLMTTATKGYRIYQINSTTMTMQGRLGIARCSTIFCYVKLCAYRQITGGDN